MKQNILTETFERFWSKQLPFVFFRLPGTQEVISYCQTDDSLLLTSDFNVSGFVFSPFKKPPLMPYIPSELKLIFNHSEIPSLASEKKIHLPDLEKKAFIELVKEAKSVIASGEFRKLVVSRQIKFPYSPSFSKPFIRLLHKYPDAMVYFWHHPKIGTWFGATPEQLLWREGKVLRSMALAGTKPYRAEEKVIWAAKEIEEQELVSGQLLKDLQYFCSKANVKKCGPFTKRAGNLLHLCTIFEVSTSLSTVALIDKIHPTPAIGGIPKEKAIAFLNEREGYNRTSYSGFLGPFKNAERLNLFVNLRCAQWATGNLTLYVGAGITDASNPESEWEETQRKAQTLIAAL